MYNNKHQNHSTHPIINHQHNNNNNKIIIPIQPINYQQIVFHFIQITLLLVQLVIIIIIVLVHLPIHHLLLIQLIQQIQIQIQHQEEEVIQMDYQIGDKEHHLIIHPMFMGVSLTLKSQYQHQYQQ